VKRLLVAVVALALALALLAVYLPSGTTAAQQDKFLGKSVDDWRQELNNSNAIVRGNAAFALGKIGPHAAPALPALRQLLLDDKTASVRDAAALAIGGIAQRDQANAPVIDALCQALTTDAEPAVQRSAAVALGQCASDTPQVRRVLTEVIHDAPPGVVQNAAWALGEICAKAAQPPVATLRKALAHKDKLVKRDAAFALGKLQAKELARAAVPDLAVCVDHEYLELRKAACFALVELVNPTHKGTEAARLLAKVCKDKTEDVDVRCNAALALSNIGGDEAQIAVPVLHGMLRMGDLDLKRRAALALRNTGEAGKAAENDLIKALQHKDDDLRHNAAVALGGLRSSNAVPALVERIADSKEKEQVRVAAAVALLYIGKCEEAVAAVPQLIEVLDNPKQPAIVRWRLLWSLRVHQVDLLKYDNLFTALRNVLREPDVKMQQGGKMLRYDCAFLLGVLKSVDAPEEALPVLQEFLADDSIRIFTGIDGPVPPRPPEVPGKDPKVVELGTEDGRIMAIKALERIGYQRVMAHPQIIDQLRKMAANGSMFEPKIRKEAGELLKAWGVK
jgi:HEAT repeat protein